MPFVPKHPPKSAKSLGVSHGVSRETRDTVFRPIDAADPVVLPSAKKRLPHGQLVTCCVTVCTCARETQPLVLLPWLLVALGPAAAQLQLTILHNNDIHAHFDPVSASTTACRDPGDPENPCYGGISRLVRAVNDIKAQQPNTLTLSGGDYFQGHLYYTLFKWQVVVDMVNRVPYDAMALGNHEFDDGLEGLLPYLEQATPPHLCTNIDFGALSSAVTDKCVSSIIREMDGQKIGILGFTTTETPVSSAPPAEVTFSDEVAALSAEAARLREQGVNIIIAVGHAGLSRERDIAEQVDGLDVVVGGHSQVLLYTGEAPDGDPTDGPYPLVVQQQSGRTVLVVQAYQYGKYLGVLNVAFDAEGEVTSWSGNPVRLEGEQDQETEDALSVYRQQVEERQQQVIGRTLVRLTGDRTVCRAEECNLGNLIADASLRALLSPAEGYWSQVSAAIVNGGGIRDSVEPGDITLANVLQIHPFGNTMDVVTLSGDTLRRVFEHSVSEVEDGAGRFLQVAGIRVTYNLDYPVGSRVRHLEIACTQCLVPRLEPVQDDQQYQVIVPRYISDGGDGYDVIRDNKLAVLNAGILDVDILQDHIERLTPVTIGIEDRILFETNSTDSDSDCDQQIHNHYHYYYYGRPHEHQHQGTPRPPHLFGLLSGSAFLPFAPHLTGLLNHGSTFVPIAPHLQGFHLTRGAGK